MKSILMKLLLPIISRYHDILRRVHDIEIVQNTLLFDSEWVDDPNKFLNGQLKRQSIVREFCNTFDFSMVIETGTFLGNTTGWFAKLWNGQTIHSCELDPRFHTLAKMRCAKFDNIHFHLNDSRKFLASLDNTNIDSLAFIYLDAHWHDDLPLKQELEIIKMKWPKSVIMIDDFEVLGDNGYSYDNYGQGKSLSYSNFKDYFLRQGFCIYGPSAKSEDETGRKRGMVILVPQIPIYQTIDTWESLRRIII